MFRPIKRPLFSFFSHSLLKSQTKIIFKTSFLLTEKKNKNNDFEFDFRKNMLFNPDPEKTEKISVKNEQNNENNGQDHTNLKVLKRELKNDLIQLPLKFFAFYTAAPNVYMIFFFN